jgi:hypothetical protein
MTTRVMTATGRDGVRRVLRVRRVARELRVRFVRRVERLVVRVLDRGRDCDRDCDRDRDRDRDRERERDFGGIVQEPTTVTLVQQVRTVAFCLSRAVDHNLPSPVVDTR